MAEPWTWSAAGDVEERWEFLTDVLPPPTGEEQRRSERIAPRIVQVFDSLETADARRWMENALAANGAGDWDVPIVQDVALLTAAASAGAMSVSVDATLRRFFAGERVLVILEDPRTFEVRTIATVASGALTFTAALDRAWPAGAKVFPLFEGTLAVIPTLERFTGDAVPVHVEFQLTHDLDWTADAGAATYRALPVLELRPDWASDPAYTPERRLAIVDNQTSAPTRYDQPGIALALYRFGYTLETRAAIVAFWSLLYALAGRWAPIWIPSWAHDFRVTGNLTAAGTTLDVARCGFSDWTLQVNRRDIRIELASGAVLYRRITAATVLDADTERLTLDAALGVNASAADVVLVSFLAVCRQDADVNLLRYWTQGVVESELSFRGYLSEF